MSQDRKKPPQMPYFHLGHSRPVTRRQLMAQGFRASTAAVLAPSFGPLSIASLAYGRSKSLASLTSFIPYMIFDLDGGAAMPGNFLVGREGGPQDLLTSYDRLGWDPRALDNPLAEDFGLPMSRNYSKILAGMLSAASSEALAKFRMGSICHFAQDDSGDNKSSPIGAISDLGNQGSILKLPLGTRRTVSGGRSDVPYVSSSLKPLALTRVSDLGAALSYGTVVRQMPQAQRALLASALKDLSGIQTEHLLNHADAVSLPGRINGVMADNERLTTGGLADVDARGDPIFASTYKISPQTADDDFLAVSATVCKNVLQRTTGPGVITIGGCDYHTGRQEDGDAKDLEIGMQIGAAIESAHRLQSPLFLQILTDGGIYPRQGTRIWQGDAGDKGLTVLGYYNPAGAPSQRRLQIGKYTNGQGADRSTLVGAEPARAAWAVFANYLSVMGMLGRMEDFAPGVFTTTELDSVLIFG